MKKFIALSFISLMAMAATNNKDLSIGDAAPLADQKMEDISGKKYSLNDTKEKNGLLVIFSCNTCPYVLGWENTYPGLHNLAKQNNIGMILVNSNEAKRSGDDSKDNMQIRADRGQYKMRYVIDNNSTLADAFGANTTPHVYLFDGDMKLVYKGAIDDKYENKDKKATQHWLNEALEALGSGQKIKKNETQNRGCSIKRV